MNVSFFILWYDKYKENLDIITVEVIYIVRIFTKIELVRIIINH